MTGLLVRSGDFDARPHRTIDHVPEHADKLFIQLVSWHPALEGRKVPDPPSLQPSAREHGIGDQGRNMGELISLAARRAVRAAASAPPARPRVSFFFDLAS